VVPQVTVSVDGIVWPVNGPITSPFGMRLHPILGFVKLHTGMDLGASCGTPVAAALAGVVTYAGVDTAYGGRVVIDHGMIGGRRLATTYSHLSALGVRVGQVVGAGAASGWSVPPATPPGVTFTWNCWSTAVSSTRRPGSATAPSPRPW
jgi:murein DD-endopeptidase MepM/ murein hydrolase activator NlpD